jgi:4-hydroxybenzoate polyprenyltransferase
MMPVLILRFIVQIINAHRPLTIVYTCGAVIAGFKLTTGMNYSTALMVLAFCLVTGNIMIFNDIMDREHDKLKGKDFCSKHPRFAFYIFILCCVKITVLLKIIAGADVLVSFFIALVWLTGLLYSFRFVRMLCLKQTVMVALCSASPILCGAIHARRAPASVYLVFFSFVILVFARELVKDILDSAIDEGYKKTLPTQMGVPLTINIIMGLIAAATFALVVFPTKINIFMVLPSLLLAGCLAVGTLFYPKKCHFIKYGIDFALSCILLTILIAK